MHLGDQGDHGLHQTISRKPLLNITISGDNEGYSLQQLCDEAELRTKNSEIAGIEWMTKILQEINCNESRQLFAAANTSRTFLQP